MLNSLEWREQTPCHTVPLQVFSPSHSELLVENIDNIELIWYKSVYGKMHTISGVTGLRYQPSVDDIGAKICVHVRAVPFEALLKTLEVGPLQMGMFEIHIIVHLFEYLKFLFRSCDSRSCSGYDGVGHRNVLSNLGELRAG